MSQCYCDKDIVGDFWKQKYKHVGEMDYEQLRETTMDPLTRVLKKVTINDAERASNAFKVCMGNQAELRRIFIEANAHLVDLDF